MFMAEAGHFMIAFAHSSGRRANTDRFVIARSLPMRNTSGHIFLQVPQPIHPSPSMTIFITVPLMRLPVRVLRADARMPLYLLTCCSSGVQHICTSSAQQPFAVSHRTSWPHTEHRIPSSLGPFFTVSVLDFLPFFRFMAPSSFVVLSPFARSGRKGKIFCCGWRQYLPISFGDIDFLERFAVCIFDGKGGYRNVKFLIDAFLFQDQLQMRLLCGI